MYYDVYMLVKKHQLIDSFFKPDENDICLEEK